MRKFAPRYNHTQMEQLIRDFPNQILKAMAIGNGFIPTDADVDYANVVISGCGGSGIGGTVAAELVAGECPVPIAVIKEYGIPAYVGIGTLFLSCSYSGNTEETISATEQALSRGAKVVVIASGGKLIEIARSQNLDHIIIPGGQPPRASFGLSFPQILYVLHGFGLISRGFEHGLEKAVELMDTEHDDIVSKATDVASAMFGRLPVIYTSAGNEGVAVRFRQQVNENSKVLCWHHVIPEMNHNELVGWTEKDNRLIVILFRNTTDHARIQLRMESNKRTFLVLTPNVLEIWSKGNGPIIRAIYQIHFGDWVSLFLARLRKVDEMEVRVIDQLKAELSRL